MSQTQEPRLTGRNGQPEGKSEKADPATIRHAAAEQNGRSDAAALASL